MGEKCLTASELIKELEKLPVDSEIFASQWFKRSSDIITHGSYMVNVLGIKEIIDIDSNRSVYCIETECKDIKEIINEQLLR